MALSQDRLIKRREGILLNDPVAAGARLYTGGLVCLDASGNAVPGSVSTTLTARGVCVDAVDNTSGAAGDLSVDSRKGVFNFKNSAGADEVLRSHVGQIAYIVDDETVAATDGTATRSAAGRIEDVNSDGVWVDIGAPAIA